MPMIRCGQQRIPPATLTGSKQETPKRPNRAFENSENLRLQAVRRKRLPEFRRPERYLGENRKVQVRAAAEAWMPALWDVFESSLGAPYLAEDFREDTVVLPLRVLCTATSWIWHLVTQPTTISRRAILNHGVIKQRE